MSLEWGAAEMKTTTQGKDAPEARAWHTVGAKLAQLETVKSKAPWLFIH